MYLPSVSCWFLPCAHFVPGICWMFCQHIVSCRTSGYCLWLVLTFLPAFPLSTRIVNQFFSPYLNSCQHCIWYWIVLWILPHLEILTCYFYVIIMKVDRHPEFKRSRCLFVIRTDGGWIDFSYQKCLRAYIRDKYPSHAERFIREHFKRGSGWY